MNCEICGKRFDEMPEKRGIVARNRVAVDLAKHFVESQARRTAIYINPAELGHNAIVKVTLEYVEEV